MAIACPNCGTRFKLRPNDSIAPPGRKVRCARCRHVWFQEPEAKKPAKSPAKKPKSRFDAGQRAGREPAPVFDPDETLNDGANTSAFDAFGQDEGHPWDDLTGLGPLDTPPDEPMPAWRKAPFQWAVLAASMVLLISVFVLFRQSVVAVWPPSVVIYDAIGLPIAVLGEGLAFENVQSTVAQDGDFAIITVTGDVRNLTGTLRAVPPVRVAALDTDGQVRDVWIAPVEPSPLLPDEVASFLIEQPDPGNTAEVEVTFDPGIL